MLESVTLKVSGGALQIPAQGITIFVGPNNSGKSLLLRELEECISSSSPPADRKIVEDFEITYPSPEEIDAGLKSLSMRYDGGPVPEGHVHVGRYLPNGKIEATLVSVDHLKRFASSKTNKHWISSQFLRFFSIRLDGRTRFDLTNDVRAGDLLDPPASCLAELFANDLSRAEVRRFLHEAFGLYFVIDPLKLGDLRIRFSTEEPENEQSLDSEAREFHSRAAYIKEMSDGVQAFTGIIASVVCSEFRTIMVDEPEAFLHPPLARTLGRQLASITRQRNGSLFASTHSSDFLMGCIQDSPERIKIVRLEYSKGVSSARSIDSTELWEIFRSPLLRSSNVVSGLFYDGVVVTESDNDRAFYSEIYHRLSEGSNDSPSILFVNAQNKQTIPTIVRPLRKFGVPVAGIADIDVIKEGGKTWATWMDAIRVPEASRPGFADHRRTLFGRFAATGVDMKASGIHRLSTDDQESARNFFDQLESYGMFIVREGELENWLPNLGAVGKKTDWVVSALERMGSDPASPEYVRPNGADVWAFMESVKRWVRDPARKGTK